MLCTANAHPVPVRIGTSADTRLAAVWIMDRYEDDACI